MILSMTRTVGANTFALTCDSNDFDIIRLAIKLGYAVPPTPVEEPVTEEPVEEPVTEEPVEEASGSSEEKPKRTRKTTKKTA